MIKTIYLLWILLSFQPNEVSILWDENYLLKWSDFKGRADDSIDAAALTASGITLEISAKTTSTELINYNAVVQAHFYPFQSWYKQRFADSFVLAHEQLHFDITELYARKLRKQIDEAKFTIKIKQEISSLNKRINRELKKTQKQYDQDSHYSRDRQVQKQWQEFVERELNKLSEYK